MIIWGGGAKRMSARELEEEVERTGKEIREDYLKMDAGGRNRPFADLLASSSTKDDKVVR